MRLITRPLKAPTEPILDLAGLQNILPLYASDKEDGIRCLTCPARGPLTGQIKPVPNRFIRDYLTEFAPHWCDGELVVVDRDGRDLPFNDIQSAIMSRDGKPNFRFRVFDLFENIYDPYRVRMRKAYNRVMKTKSPYITWLPHYLCHTIGQLEHYEADALRRGKEGIMLNSPDGWYKENRSTLNEHYLLKVKRFTDDEAEVIGVEEEMENTNEAKLNERGLSQRSKHKAGLKGKGMVGKLVCRWRRHIIYIASGMTESQKILWWANPRRIMGKTITFKYQAHGMKVLPRAPIFKSIRDPRG